MDTALHITINKAGSPEKLGELVKAAVEAAAIPVRRVVPAGYRCVECYKDDGGHEPGCSVGVMAGRAAQGPEGSEQ